MLTVQLTNAQGAALLADLGAVRDARAAEMAEPQPEPLAERSTAAYLAATLLIRQIERHTGLVARAEQRERALRQRKPEVTP